MLLVVKNPPATQEPQVRSLGREDPSDLGGNGWKHGRWNPHRGATQLLAHGAQGQRGQQVWGMVAS